MNTLENPSNKKTARPNYILGVYIAVITLITVTYSVTTIVSNL
ncbi:MAG: hypothetical protein OQJ83_00065 [Altibacter sp.]|nr:hypothetical protein [Altibacter lentus]MCW8979752.1 hypothetical protein [Altibacter sp.]